MIYKAVFIYEPKRETEPCRKTNTIVLSHTDYVTAQYLYLERDDYTMQRLTTVVGEPGGLQVEGWTDVEDVRVGAVPQMRDAQLGPGGGPASNCL